MTRLDHEFAREHFPRPTRPMHRSEDPLPGVAGQKFGPKIRAKNYEGQEPFKAVTKVIRALINDTIACLSIIVPTQDCAGRSQEWSTKKFKRRLMKPKPH